VSEARSGIIIKIPRKPAVAPIRKISKPLGARSRKISAGT